MIANIEIKNKTYKVDLSNPIDISFPLIKNEIAPSAWYVNPLTIEPVVGDNFVGDVNQGSGVNFRNIFFNPHGHGTHTECVGHISKEWISVNNTLKEFHFLCQVITVVPQTLENGDKLITEANLTEIHSDACALAVRTIPNNLEHKKINYSSTNPPYFSTGFVKKMNQSNINHWLVDLPSVDRELDNGVLASHHEFWNYPSELNNLKTITEFIYIDNSIPDGLYLLNLMIAPFENDATPSKPVLYKIIV